MGVETFSYFFRNNKNPDTYNGICTYSYMIKIVRLNFFELALYTMAYSGVWTGLWSGAGGGSLGAKFFVIKSGGALSGGLALGDLSVFLLKRKPIIPVQTIYFANLQSRGFANSIVKSPEYFMR